MRKYAFTKSHSPSILLAYPRFTYLRPTHHAPLRRQPAHSSVSVASTHFRRTQKSIAQRSPRHRLTFPAGSFLGGFRTPASVQAAAPRSAGIRNPQQKRTPSRTVGMSQRCHKRARQNMPAHAPANAIGPCLGGVNAAPASQKVLDATEHHGFGSVGRP